MTQDMWTAPLVQALQVAVPLWIVEAGKRHGDIQAELLAGWRAEAVDVICAHGDILQYRGGKRGDTANAFNHLARGMAALACHPGGFEAFGLMWCARHSPAGAVPAARGVCTSCLADQSA